MALRTAQQYVESLRDGRNVYMLGEKIDDVTTHPNTSASVQHCSNVFSLALDPDYQDLFTVKENGDRISRYFSFPKNPEDLETRRHLIGVHTGLARGQLNLTKAIGSDALMATVVTAHQIKEKTGNADYSNRIEEYIRWVKAEDPTVICALTDTKGDRSRRPHEQAEPDVYVHIVERRTDGIVVRGAKAHTTASLTSNEIFVAPTRAMGEQDADYAVAFAVPANAPGLHMICRPMLTAEASQFDNPISSRNPEGESVTVFDDVFVPWERVFLAGEWQFAGMLAVSFANFHRFTGVSYRPAIGDLMVGAAQLIADYNGLARAPHIRDKIASLVKYTEMIRACAIAAAQNPHIEPPGIALPNVVYTNIGKHHFADSFHEAVRVLQDIAGGLVITTPVEADLKNPQTGDYIRKYLVGKDGVPTEDRLKLFHFIRDLTASDFGGYALVGTLHGEGPQAAQNMALMADYDIARCVQLVKDGIGIVD
jgi:aromatic ring hydroxylase